MQPDRSDAPARPARTTNANVQGIDTTKARGGLVKKVVIGLAVAIVIAAVFLYRS